MKTFLTFILLISSSAWARNPVVYLPSECDYEENSKKFGKEKLDNVAFKQGTGALYDHIHPKRPQMHCVDKKDLSQEIFYFDPLTSQCQFKKLSETPFGIWVSDQITWRTTQHLEKPSSVCYKPVTTRPIDLNDWLELPLGSMANTFDHVAYEGYSNTVESASTCYKDPEKVNVLSDFSKSFLKYYHRDLKQITDKLK